MPSIYSSMTIRSLAIRVEERTRTNVLDGPEQVWDLHLGGSGETRYINGDVHVSGLTRPELELLAASIVEALANVPPAAAVTAPYGDPSDGS